ncbi:MAG: TetR/AcrR family transcriptional regulator, partial [Actinomycetota bacterium]|nr:TetR/AcrR family transcriptional regulator [Actinomycetota bacterium]
MPKVWNTTIDAHRRAVRDATLDSTAALVAEHGLR